MKKLLSLLLCYVFLQTETFALRGGPGGSGSHRLTGSYSGIITQTGGGSDVGLFLLTAQSSGASNGSIVFFSQTTSTTPGRPGPIGFGTTSSSGGRYYGGTITGLSDPTSGTFVGLFNATAQVSSTIGAVAVISTLSLAGTMKISASSIATSSSSQQVTGTASAQSSAGSVHSYTISGWQTSADAVSGGFGQVDNSGG